VGTAKASELVGTAKASAVTVSKVSTLGTGEP
jgi:hypothetical protein